MSSKRFIQVVGLVGAAMLLAGGWNPVQVTQDVPGQVPILDTLVIDSIRLAPTRPGGSTATGQAVLRDRTRRY